MVISCWLVSCLTLLPAFLPDGRLAVRWQPASSPSAWLQLVQGRLRGRFWPSLTCRARSPVANAGPPIGVSLGFQRHRPWTILGGFAPVSPTWAYRADRNMPALFADLLP